MKFNEYKYKRLDIKAFQVECKILLIKMEDAKDYKEFKSLFDDMQALFDHAESMLSLVHIRYTVNTNDEFYAKENDFWDESTPLVLAEKTKFTKMVFASKFKEDLMKDIPKTYFMLGENEIKTFNDAVLEDLQEENRLESSYQKLIASAKIEMDGKVYTLEGLGALMECDDASMRERAYKGYWGYLESNEKEIDTTYDKLVHLRDKIAKKLGFPSFIELGYARERRLDYDAKDVAGYRAQVLKEVVPLASELYAKQAKRLGVDKIDYYNEKIEFLSGNPTPKHNMEEMIAIAQKMYRELSPETGEFFDFMVNHELLDLDSKDGKAAGGYCTYIPDYDSPFIFSNFNGTSGDVDVLTHEAGHAFQVFSSRGIKPLDCIWPTHESCEIHSMGMEFFAWPWMKDFFEEDAPKYFYSHLASAVKFLPYGVLVDHFQHEVYANVDMTPAERKETWRRLEKQYLPHKNYGDLEILEKGCWWFRQPHIFLSPFYYIDYTLAQVCALQFWLRLQKEDPTAFEDYYNICKIGGTLPFKEIVKEANLIVPFDDGCLASVMEDVKTYLMSSQHDVLK